MRIIRHGRGEELEIDSRDLDGLSSVGFKQFAELLALTHGWGAWHSPNLKYEPDEVVFELVRR